jgi:hypothetical protein
MQQYVKQFLIGIAVLLVAILAMHFYYVPKVAELEQQVIQLKLQSQSDIIKKLDEIAKTRKDSVWVIQKEIVHYASEQQVQQHHIDTTRSVDSLINLYYGAKSELLLGPKIE